MIFVMPSLNNKDEQTTKIEKENGYSVVTDVVVADQSPDAERELDENGEAQYVVYDFSGINDLQSLALSYLFSFLPAPFIDNNGIAQLDDKNQYFIDFNINDNNKIYEKPDERKKLTASLSLLSRSLATTAKQDSKDLVNFVSSAVRQEIMPESKIKSKRNIIFDNLVSNNNLILTTHMKPDKDGVPATRLVPSGDRRNQMNNQVYKLFIDQMLSWFKNDKSFSKMLEVVKEIYQKYSLGQINMLDRQKNIKKIVDTMQAYTLQENVENNDMIKTSFLVAPNGERLFSKIQFKDGLVFTASDLLINESNADCYVFEKNITDKATGESTKKKYCYNTVTKTLIEYTDNKSSAVYRNYSGSSVKKYTDGYKTTLNGKNFLYCNGGEKLVCIDQKDKQFGFEFTAITDKQKQRLVKSEPGMTFGYWTTYDKEGNIYHTVGQRSKDDFCYNLAHEAKQGNDFSVSIKNNQTSQIEKENKENLIKSRRLINGCESVRLRSDVKTIYSKLGISGPDSAFYDNLVSAYSDFLVHKKEREQTYAKNYDYEQAIIERAAKEKEKQDKKNAKEKEKNFRKLVNDIYKEKLEHAETEPEDSEKLNAFNEKELNDVKNIINRLKQDAFKWDASKIKSTEESGVSLVLNFLLKILTFGAVDISKRHKEEIEANNQEIMDAYVGNVLSDIKERTSLLNKLADYIRLYGNMNGAIENLDNISQALINVGQEYSQRINHGDANTERAVNSFLNIANSGILSSKMAAHQKDVNKQQKQNEIKLQALEEARQKIELKK